MKVIICYAVILLAVSGRNLKAQPVQLDSQQVERVAKACQLWGHLKYFHPYLSENSIDWEDAFTETIKDVISAESTEEFGHSIQRMLGFLNDPATIVKWEKGDETVEDTVKYPKLAFIQDSILLFTIKDYTDLEDYPYAMAQFDSLVMQMPLSKGVIIDIRSEGSVPVDWSGMLNYYFEGMESNFSNVEIEIPGLKARFHDGFVPESGGTSGGYYSGFYVKGNKKIPPAQREEEIKTAFIVNGKSEIPLLAIGLVNAGQAMVFSTDSLNDASLVETLHFNLEEDLVATLRMNTLDTDHTGLGLDYLLPDDYEEEDIVMAAARFLTGDLSLNNRDAIVPVKKTKQEELNGQNNSAYPDLASRLLAISKIWTVIDYFFAYKDLMESDWDEVLKKFIPRFALAADSIEYHLAVAEMYNHIQDGHGFMRSSVLLDYFGVAAPPIQIRYVEEQPVVVGILPDSVYEVKSIEVGDIILQVDGEDVKDKFNRLAKYTAHSNQSWLQNVISYRLLTGPDSTTTFLKIKKSDGREQDISLPRYLTFTQRINQLGRGRNELPVTRLINKDIGYADLDRLRVDMVPEMFEDFKETKAIILDMRGYPNGTGWTIGPYLTGGAKDVFAANFRRYAPMNMNLVSNSTNLSIFDQAIPSTKVQQYHGVTVMLIDERALSQAEHTGLFFEAANGTRFIGSQTGGANGDVTNFQIPGNISLFFSGHDVRHADGRQLQKVGLVPDVEVKPTIEGVRKGKDEVLEKAIEYITGMVH